jgi:hypothetical protein
MLKFGCVLLIVALSVFCGVADGKVLFIDDFEQDSVGAEPSDWEQLNFAKGNSKITVVDDPQNPGNRVAKTIGIGLYIPKVAGRENWADYIWEFDWMWENDDHVGTIYRVEDVEAHYHASRRKGGELVNIYTRMAGSWNEIASGEYKTENGDWYRHRLVIKGNDHAIYLRPRDDDTPFESLGPVVEVDDGTIKKGPIGMMGITSGVSYYDNMIVVETLEDLKNLHAVEYASKLAATWGGMKDR